MGKTVECKSCKRPFKNTSILKHLSQTKKNCKLKYNEEELKSMKDNSIRRARYKERKWRTKNSGYYSHYRADHYKRNKEIILKKQAEFDAKNKDKIKLRKSKYYQWRRKYHEQFHYYLYKTSFHNGASRINSEKICGVMKDKSTTMKSEYNKMLEKLKMKGTEEKILKKNLIFIEKEIESTISDLLSVIYHTEKEMNCEYDSEAKYDMSVSVFLLIDVVLENIEKFLINLDKDHSKIDINNYHQRSNRAWKEFKKDRKKAKTALVTRRHGKIHSYYKEYKKENEMYLRTAVLDRAKENMAYFEEQGVAMDIKQKFDEIKEEISTVLKDLRSETDEVEKEIEELICDWTENTINWKEKEESDKDYIQFNFNNLNCYIDCEKSKLQHKVQVALKVISRDIEILPLKPFFYEQSYKCNDSNCKCIEFNDWKIKRQT